MWLIGFALEIFLCLEEVDGGLLLLLVFYYLRPSHFQNQIGNS